MFGNIEERTHRLEADYIDEVREEGETFFASPSIGNFARPPRSFFSRLHTQTPCFFLSRTPRPAWAQSKPRCGTR